MRRWWTRWRKKKKEAEDEGGEFEGLLARVVASRATERESSKRVTNRERKNREAPKVTVRERERERERKGDGKYEAEVGRGKRETVCSKCESQNG